MKEFYFYVKSVVNVVEDGILVVDFNKRIMLFNKRLELLFQLFFFDVVDCEI